MSQRKKNPRLSQDATASPSTQQRELATLIESVDYEAPIANIVQYLLIAEQKKYPVKRADLTKFAPTSQRNSTKIFNAVINAAKQHLEKVFGLSVEVEDGNYFVVNKLDNNCPKPEEVSAEQTLVVLVLCKTFLAGGVIKEEDLLSLIEKAGFTGPAVPAMKLQKSGLIDGKGLLKEISRQGYLSSNVIELNDGEISYLEYRWGPRAEKEFSKMQMLELAGKWYNRQPRDFGELYKEALQEDSNAEARNDDDVPDE